jgi:hypothetical protein
MKKFLSVFYYFLVIFLSYFVLAPLPLLPCPGNMAWRFLPIEIARKEDARIEAELKKQRERFELLSLPSAIQKWIKFYDNPVFHPGPRGSWEEKSVDSSATDYNFNQ